VIPLDGCRVGDARKDRLPTAGEARVIVEADPPDEDAQVGVGDGARDRELLAARERADRRERPRVAAASP
jgi:hypothetical protein